MREKVAALLERVARWYIERRVRAAVGANVTLPRWVADPPLPPFRELQAGGDRHTVTRRVQDKTWVLYDGPNGGTARRWVEHVRREREPGKMWFATNGVVRDVYDEAKR